MDEDEDDEYDDADAPTVISQALAHIEDVHAFKQHRRSYRDNDLFNTSLHCNSLCSHSRQTSIRDFITPDY